MVDEHEKLPSGKLAEAIAACHKALARKHPQQTLAMVDNFEHLAAVVDAARKFAALEPLLRELCEARGKSTQGEWEAILNSDPRGVPVVMYRGLICTTEHGVKYQAVVAKNGYVASSEWNANTDFIATAANITARIGEVVDGK